MAERWAVWPAMSLSQLRCSYCAR